MPATLYLGTTGTGKSYLMRAHVAAIAGDKEAPFFFVVDHDNSWGDLQGAVIYNATADWWANPAPLAIFRGVLGQEVAQLAIDVGWAIYVDDEVDAALENWKESPLREILKRGRHIKNRAGQITAVTMMIATHRPSNLPADALGLFDRVYVGRLQSFRDAERVHQEGWIPSTTSAVEAREILERREPGEFTVWPT